MPEKVFINCVTDDLPLVRGIAERLDLAGISYYVVPASLDPGLQKDLVEKIMAIAGAQGCMLCILSKKAVSNSLFVSNIQLMCETARNKKVLVEYQVEDLDNDQKIRLFDSQASLVKGTGQALNDISTLIKRINQVIHPPARNVFQFLSRNISRKLLTWLFISAAAVGVAGSLAFNLMNPAPIARRLPSPTPVVMYAPFSGQSQDVGLTVDARFVPGYKPVTDPATDAPFSFSPGTILEQDDFNDPKFDNTYDGQKWNVNHFMLDDVSSMAVTQNSGVLQMAVAPVGDQPVTLTLDSKYLFNPEQLTYLGYRFRLDDYEGRVRDKSVFKANFSYPDINLDGISQKFDGYPDLSLGSRWHTVEMLSQKDKHFVDVYLDGKRLRTLTFDDERLVHWTHLIISLNASNTNDWIRIQIDEIIIGSEGALPEALRPENAAYRFTPDKIDLHVGLETAATPLIVVEGSEYVAQAGGVFSFRFPAGKAELSIRAEIPGKPIDEDNYYATRFRFTSPDDNAWSDWARFYIGLENMSFQSPTGFDLLIGSNRREYNFQGFYGLNGIVNAFAYNQGAQPGIWHTLEMLIKPPAGSSTRYTLYYWVDGYLLGKGDLDNPAPFLDANAPLAAIIQIFSGEYRQNVFSGEIDDLVIGTISGDKIQE